MRHYKILPNGYDSLEDFHPLERSAIFLADCFMLGIEDRQKRVLVRSQVQVIRSTPDLEFIKEMNLSHMEEWERLSIANSKKESLIAEWEGLLND